MDADGAIIYGAGLVHDAFSLTVGSAFSGSLDQRSFDSVAMKRWIGTIRDRTGHSFNQTICKHMRSLGFEARDSVPMSEFGAGQLGDIDVLSSSKEYKIVLVIECKHLRFARTVGEIGEQLRRFAGEPGDQVHKHLRRVRWLDEHRPLLQKRLRLDGTFELSHLLVTNALVPMAFSRSLPIDNRHISTERDLASAIERIVSDRRSDIGS